MYKFIWFLPVFGLLGCTAFYFQPLERHFITPGDLGLDYSELYFSSRDDTRLHGWWLPAVGEARGSVLFLHGNAENISTHIGSVRFLPQQGLNVLLFDYRGYGRSDGTANLEGLLMDVEAGLEQFIRHDGTGNLVVFGQSLGAALAILVVANSPLRDEIEIVVADSGFTSFRDLAREKFSSHWLTWLFQWPLAMTVSDAYRPIDEIERLSPTEVLLVHSKSDEIIPFHHSEKLFHSAREPRSLWLTHGSRHIGFFASHNNQMELARRLLARF